MTAWKSIQKKALKAKFILEFDLKSFFDTLNIQYISRQLGTLGTPPGIIELLESYNLSTPQPPQIKKPKRNKKIQRTEKPDV
jgi:hypothetical protein